MSCPEPTLPAQARSLTMWPGPCRSLAGRQGRDCGHDSIGGRFFFFAFEAAGGRRGRDRDLAVYMSRFSTEDKICLQLFTVHLLICLRVPNTLYLDNQESQNAETRQG